MNIKIQTILFFQIRANQVKPLKYPIIFIRSMRNCGKKARIRIYLYGLFSRLLFSITDSSYKVEQHQIVPQSIEDLTKNIKQYLDTHRYKISGSELSAVFHFHKDYLSKVFQAKMNQTIKKYNQAVCMEEAYNLLCNSQLTISEIADVINYSSRSQFYAAFESTFGMKPSFFFKMITGQVRPARLKLSL